MVEKKGKLFQVYTSEARYEKPLLQQIIQDNFKTWRETMSRDKYQFKWFHSKTEDAILLEELKDPGKMANRIPGIQGLAHKDTFNRLFKVGQAIDPEVCSIIPGCFTFPQDQEAFADYHKKHREEGAIYIAKPVASSEGNSIMLFRELSELPSLLSNEMVVQRYIHKPLLVDGLKFDLRVYVVIVGTNPLSAYVCDEGLARFCTEKYEEPTKENFKQYFMHLTNYSINKHSPGFQESDNILESNHATKRTITSLMKTLKSSGVDVDLLRQNINDTCARGLSVYGPLIEHNLTVATNGKPVEGRFFQILGFDVLPDADLKCHLLEINDHPSLDIFLDKEFMGGGSREISQIDLYVKKRVVEDAIKLTKKPKEKILETESHRSLTRVLPMDEGHDAYEVWRTLQAAREVYYSITVIKQKATIYSSNFEKLLYQSISMPWLQLSATDLMLCYQKLSQNQKMIDFLSFFWVIKGTHKLMREAAVSLAAPKDTYSHVYDENLLVFLTTEFKKKS